MLKAISNSGPLIHLAQINFLRALNIFDEITVPASVFEEITVIGKPGDAEIRALRNLRTVQFGDSDVKAVARLRQNLRKWKLDPAESDAILLAQKRKEMLLTDDLDAREAAESLGIEVHGSVGIIVRAFRQKTLSRKDAVSALTALYEKSKLFVSKSIIDDAVSEIRRSSSR